MTQHQLNNLKVGDIISNNRFYFSYLVTAINKVRTPNDLEASCLLTYLKKIPENALTWEYNTNLLKDHYKVEYSIEVEEEEII